MSMMDELRAVVDSLTPEQRAMLGALVGERASATDEPIAIVGMAGRFPGARHLDEFWRLLVEGRDAISEIPAARWSAAAFYDPDRTKPGKMATRWGGFLDDVDRFDAAFFGIAPREAAAMDPQQRLFLETAWHAFEDAGVPVSSLRGAPAGVFVGVSNVDYLWHQFADLARVDAYASSGSSHGIIANRLSYLYDFTGPSVAVDTACSSSLVAVHLACQSLRSRECTTAVAGGVNLILTPHLCVSLSDWGMMAADGRCKTFDARADGFVRGEGCGAVVLKRLADAQRDGDRVLAIVRGSAVNQDGKTNGLTAPNGAAQRAVIQQALARAGLAPSQISFLETHGTGTSLGDPIEVEAINEVFSAAGARCVLGAVKTHIGHLEPAAGIAGLIKTVLALQHELIPRNLHYQALNPHLTLGRGIELASEARPWQRTGAPRCAGVSAFSFGGTNAHVVLEEAPASAAESGAPAESGALVILPLSASDEGARRQLAAAHAEQLEQTAELAVETVAGLRALHRDHLDVRAAIVAPDRASAIDALRSVAAGRPHPAAVEGRREPQLRPVFVYTGQGSQWLGMGRELARTEPVFRDAIAEADALFQRLGAPRHAAFFEGGEAPLERTDVAQPAIFLLQVALTKLLAHWGIRPGAVAGHSVGEIAAAWAAGILSLEDAVRVVHHRSRLMQRVAGSGAMVSAALSPQDAARVAGERVAIAAHNSPRDVVFSGAPGELAELVRRLEERGVRCKKLPVDYAFHSAQLDPVRAELVRALAGLAPQPPRVAFYSTVTGQRERGAVADAQHWARNMREPVRFTEAIARIAADGPSCFLEVGPHPALAPYVAETLADLQREAPAAHCMRRAQSERRELLAAVATLYVHGIDPDWSRLVRKPDRRWSLPHYPWQRQRFWIESPGFAGAHGIAARGASEAESSGGVSRAPAASARAYEIAWPACAPAPARGDARASYLVFSDGSALASELRAAFQAAGAPCWWVARGAAFTIDGASCTLDPEQPEHLERLFRQLAAAPFAFDHVLLLFASERAEHAELSYDAAAHPVQVLRGLVQGLLHHAADRRATLAVITRGAVDAGGDRAVIPERAALWGFGRALALEDASCAPVLLDVAGEGGAAPILAKLAEAAAVNTKERQLAWRDGQWRAARLAALSVRDADASAPLILDGRGTYLLTGGLGSLGLATAQRLAERGGKTLALVGRRAPAAEQLAAIARIEAAGARVVTVRADIADPADAARVFEALRSAAPPIRGVVHAAGIVEDGLLAHATKESFDRVLRPKLAGSWNLHRLTQAMELEFFVLFSSAAATVGSAGQTSYAAANAFLQGVAEHRRARGQRALCVHWGAWRESAMVSDSVASKLATLGFATIDPARALDALERLIRSDATAATVIAADWNAFATRAADPGLDRFLSLVRDAAPRTADVAAPAEGTALAALAGVPASQRQKVLFHHLRAVVLAALGMDAHTAVRPDQGLVELGLDSLLALRISNQLSRDLNRRLPKSLVYDHPTLHQLTDYLLGASFPAPAQSRAIANDEIASASAETIQSLLDAELADLLPLA